MINSLSLDVANFGEDALHLAVPGKELSILPAHLRQERPAGGINKGDAAQIDADRTPVGLRGRLVPAIAQDLDPGTREFPFNLKSKEIPFVVGRNA
jgi:hypothetical protein